MYFLSKQRANFARWDSPQTDLAREIAHSHPQRAAVDLQPQKPLLSPKLTHQVSLTHFKLAVHDLALTDQIPAQLHGVLAKESVLWLSFPVDQNPQILAAFQIDHVALVPERRLRVFGWLGFDFLEKVAVEIHLNADVQIWNATCISMYFRHLCKIGSK